MPSLPKRTPVVVGYLALLLLSLAVPMLHHYRTDGAIEAMRPYLKSQDGSYFPMLLPTHILLLRSLGQLSSLLPVGLLAACAFSIWRENFARPAALCIAALGQCAFTTFYALYSTSLLGSEWLQRVPR